MCVFCFLGIVSLSYFSIKVLSNGFRKCTCGACVLVQQRPWTGGQQGCSTPPVLVASPLVLSCSWNHSCLFWVVAVSVLLVLLVVYQHTGSCVGGDHNSSGPKASQWHGSLRAWLRRAAWTQLLEEQRQTCLQAAGYLAQLLHLKPSEHICQRSSGSSELLEELQTEF